MQAQKTAVGSRISKATIDQTVVIAAKTSTVSDDGSGGAGTRMQKESATAIFLALCAFLQRRFGFNEAVQARMNELFQSSMQQLLTENVSVTRGNLITTPIFSQKLLSSLQSLALNGTTDQVQIDAAFWQIADRDQSTYRNGPFYFIHDVAISVTPAGKEISESTQQYIDNFETKSRSGLTVRELSTVIFAFAATGTEGSKTTVGTTFVAAGSLWGNRSGVPTLTGSSLERISTDEPIDSSYCVPSYGHSSGDY